MDFFASQELARRNTKKLIVYFAIALILMIAAIYIVVVVALGAAGVEGREFTSTGLTTLFDPLLLAIVAFVVSSFVGMGSLYKVSALRGGGENVASMLGGRYVPANSSDLIDRKVLNVVEEMALAAGTPVPPVYMLDQEGSINAFAAGYTVDDAVIGLNRGTVENLTRDELQGVVAHEFSHILNGDMRMSIRMIGILHGIQLLALVGYYVLRSMRFSSSSRSRSNGKGGGGALLAILIISLGLIVVGSIGLFFARLIKASVSRQREYLADASAVQFTRNPEGIAGALKMIGASVKGSAIDNPHAEEASHMFFSSMFQKTWFNAFATHPPLVQRIQAIEPRFDGDFSEFTKKRIERKRRRDEARRERKRRQQEREEKLRIGFPGGKSGLPGMMGDQFPIDPAILIAGIGSPDEDDVEYSELIVDGIPKVIAEAARDLFSARCVVFASLLNPQTEIRRAQLFAIAKTEGQATIDETIRLMPHIDSLEPRFRLPVFEILQGSLTAMSPEQYQVFRRGIDHLIEADNRVDLFEFFLRYHLIVHLDRRFGLIKPPRVKYLAIENLRDPICALLAVMIRAGHMPEDQARQAFEAAIDSIGKPWTSEVGRIGQEFNYQELAKALQHLNVASAAIKKRVLTAMAVAITFDKIVTVGEAELFRAMSESLDCPVPPVVASEHERDA